MDLSEFSDHEKYLLQILDPMDAVLFQHTKEGELVLYGLTKLYRFYDDFVTNNPHKGLCIGEDILYDTKVSVLNYTKNYSVYNKAVAYNMKLYRISLEKSALIKLKYPETIIPKELDEEEKQKIIKKYKEAYATRR